MAMFKKPSVFSGLVRKIVIAKRDNNTRILQELATLPENDHCADCGAPEPGWASTKPGVFVCVNCSVTHRDIYDSSNIKSIHLDIWPDNLVEHMRTIGNANAKAVYEKDVPVYYYRPQQDDCAVLREQWIHAKYERVEFNGNTKYPPLGYTAGLFEGVLWKKGKHHGQFLERKFVISETDFTLAYYKEEEPEDDAAPKASIPIKDMNAMFQPEKIDHIHGLQITFQEDNHTRNIYVYHEIGEEIVTWYNAIRAARYAYLKKTNPKGSDEELIPKITRSYLKEGYVEKRPGPLVSSLQWGPFKKRWFSLDSQERKLLHFKSQMDSEEQGVLFIGEEVSGYSVSESVHKGVRRSKWKCGVTMETPGRQVVFMCEEEKDQREWVEAIKQVIAQPMQPQDYATEVNMRAKH